MPRRQRCAASAAVTSTPRNRTVPPEAGCPPARTLNRVVLPAPLGPTMPTASSAPTVKSTLSRTTSAPNRLHTPVPSRMAPVSCESTIHSTSAVVRVQFGTDRDVLVVGVFCDDVVELKLAARLRLHPLGADCLLYTSPSPRDRTR